MGAYEGRNEKQFYMYGPSLVIGDHWVSYVRTEGAASGKSCDVLHLADGTVIIPEHPVHLQQLDDISKNEAAFRRSSIGQVSAILSKWPKIVALIVNRVFDVADTLYSAGDFTGEVAELEKLRALWLTLDERTLLDAIVDRLSDYRRSLHPDTVAAQIVRLKREVFSIAHRTSGSLAAARALGLLLAQPPIADRVSALPFLEAVYSQNPDDKEVVFEFSQCCVAARKYDEAIGLLRSDAYGDPGNEGKFMTYVGLLRLLDRARTEKQYLADQLAAADIEKQDEYCIQYAFLCRSLGTSQEVLERFLSIPGGQRSSAVLVAIGLAFEDLNRQQEASVAFRDAERTPNACRFAAHFANRVTDDLNHMSRMLAIAENRARDNKKPRAAIMISGLVRDYRFAYGLRQFIERCEGWTIDLFAHMFDRLGDLRISRGHAQGAV